MKKSRLAFVAMMLLTGAFTLSAQTSVTVFHTDGTGSDVFALTDASRLKFSSGQLLFENVAGSRPISLKDINSIKFKTKDSGAASVGADSAALFLRRNPVGETLVVDGTVPESSALEVYSPGGTRLIRMARWDGAPVDVSSLPGGLYFLKINNLTIKFIKL